jgi:hypothetical protein
VSLCACERVCVCVRCILMCTPVCICARAYVFAPGPCLLWGFSHRGQVLVLAPTREIAFQIYEVFLSISTPKGAVCHCFIGGLAIADDVLKLDRCHVAIGTPGRLQELAERQHLDLARMRLCVLDEADKLLSGSIAGQTRWVRVIVGARDYSFIICPSWRLACLVMHAGGCCPGCHAKGSSWPFRQHTPRCVCRVCMCVCVLADKCLPIGGWT